MVALSLCNDGHRATGLVHRRCLVVFALFGVTRDYLYSVTTRLIVFGPGLVPLIADLFAYASAAAVVQLLMYWIAGPAQADPLARMPQASAAPKS